MSNPFAEAEAWDVSGGQILSARPEPYLCTIESVDGTASSSRGNPQIDVKLVANEGSITDWVVVLPQTLGRVVQLTDAVGLPRPKDEEVAPDGEGFRLHPQYLASMVGKQVGVFVNAERDQMDPTKMRDRVRSYCPAADAQKAQPAGGGGPAWGGTPAAQHTGSPGPGGTFFPAATGAKPANAIDDDIPF
jgi:hypothetical protein